MAKKNKTLDWIANLLVILGGINWGLVGIADFNLVSQIFGISTFATIIYSAIGLSAIWSGFKLLK